MLLELESYRPDTDDVVQTDSIEVNIVEPEVILPRFEDELELKELKIDELSTWVLPNIVEGSFPLAEIKFYPPSEIASFISLDLEDRKVTF